MADLVKLAERARHHVQEAEKGAEELRCALEAQRESVTRQLQAIIDQARAAHVHLGAGDFEAFLEEPYCVVPAGEGEWRVVCPRWVDFHIGVLERTTASYNVFRVNKYAKWLGDVPAALAEKFQFKEPLAAVVEGGFVHVRGAADQDVAWERYKKHLTQRDGSTKLRIKKGAEFRLVADMIQDGILPFVPQAVSPEHLREAGAWWAPSPWDKDQEEAARRRLELRPYQERAWEEFLARGALGVYWPMGAGKTVIALHAMAHLKGGRFLVVVPTATLVEQWRERIHHHLHRDVAAKVDVVTYQGLKKVRDRKYLFAAFDECHVLPANTFAAAATIPCEYRMGLSATPYREDGRTDLIFALTGYPVGLDWGELIELGVIEVPTITLHLSETEADKTRKLEELLHEGKRTVVFCDGIDKGNALAKRFGLTFVDGSATRRLETIRACRQVIVSRVGDEGLSLPDLERVVEVDFLMGSRRQEGQRMGRLFHADRKGEHWVLMTRDEHERYQKRLLAIREKGFRIRVERDTRTSG